MDPKKVDEFRLQLSQAHVAAERALSMLYSDTGPKRGFFYRMALGRAQNILIKLYILEAKRKTREGRSG